MVNLFAHHITMSQIQAVYALGTDKWTPTLLRAWLKKHGLKPIKRVHIVGDEIRYRILPPLRFARFTTKKLPGGIHLVLGWL